MSQPIICPRCRGRRGWYSDKGEWIECARCADGTDSHKPQQPSDQSIDRSDHVWLKTGRYESKCVLCGGVCKNPPPPYPTPDDYNPLRYEKLTVEEKSIFPYKNLNREN